MKLLVPQSVLNTLPTSNQKVILGTTFFPTLISQPFIEGMRIVFYAGAFMTAIAAIFSIFRGKKFIYPNQKL